jgi:hypothetical protein
MVSMDGSILALYKQGMITRDTAVKYEGISDNSIAGKLQKYYDMTEDNAWAALKDGILYPQQ